MFRLFLFLVFLPSLIFSQNITYGPIVGGVTPESARMILFTDSTASISIELSLDSSFSNIKSCSGITRSTQGNSVIINIDSLVADRKYYFRASVNGTLATGIRSFQTYPLSGEAGNYTFLFGSCENDNLNDDEIFIEALNHPARFFLQIGDWGYPDVTDNLPNNNDFFSADYNRVIDSYKDKYSYRYMKEYLKNIAVDYVWDDHDYVNNNSSSNTASYTDFGIPVQLLEVAFPPGTRRNSIEGYYNLFPGYEPVDSSAGIFHKFRFGNMEVFMLDDRAARSPTTYALQNNGGQLTFAPPPGHSIIGDVQRQWLLDQLKKSTATWKFITTATAFNKTYGNTLNAVLQLPALIAQPLAAAIIDSWSGFPMDQDSLINTVRNEKIDGVILMSGDTHTAAIDDGQAGGLPEIMAGCLSQTNSTLVNTVPLLSLGLVWSEGGQGIGNVNTKDAFGKITAFADDSVKLELIDEDGDLLADHTIYSCSYLTGLDLTANTTVPIRCHGDSTGSFNVTASGGSPPYRYTLDGEHYQTSGLFTALPAGAYHPAVKDNNGCTKELSIVLKQPDKLNANIDKTDVSCFGFANGSADLTITGGIQPYKLEWSTDDSTEDLTGLTAATYQVNITDSNKCTVSKSFQINQPDKLEVQTSKADISCFGKKDGLVALSFIGGTAPYQIAWSNGTTVPAQNSLASGTYTYTISDDQNCIVTDSVAINEPDSISIETNITPDYGGQGNGSIQLMVSGGTSPYSYSWFDNSTENSNSGLFPGIYTVSITDANGCKKETSIVVPLGTAVEEYSLAQLKLYPNPAKDKFIVEGLKFKVGEGYVLKLFDVSGKNVLESKLENKKTNVSVKELKSGVYFYSIQPEDASFPNPTVSTGKVVIE